VRCALRHHDRQKNRKQYPRRAHACRYCRVPIQWRDRRSAAERRVEAVIRGETYHFEIVANESAAGIASVQLEFGIPIGNGILTTDTEEQARERASEKGGEAALAAVEMANLMGAIDEE